MAIIRGNEVLVYGCSPEQAQAWLAYTQSTYGNQGETFASEETAKELIHSHEDCGTDFTKDSDKDIQELVTS